MPTWRWAAARLGPYVIRPPLRRTRPRHKLRECDWDESAGRFVQVPRSYPVAGYHAIEGRRIYCGGDPEFRDYVQPSPGGRCGGRQDELVCMTPRCREQDSIARSLSQHRRGEVERARLEKRCP